MRSLLASILFTAFIPLTASAQPKVEGTRTVCLQRKDGYDCAVLVKKGTKEVTLEKLRQAAEGTGWKHGETCPSDFRDYPREGESCLGYWYGGKPVIPSQEKADLETVGLVVACRVDIFCKFVSLGTFQGVNRFNLAVFVNSDGEVYTCPVKTKEKGCNADAAQGSRLTQCLRLTQCAENSRDNLGLRHCSCQQ